MNNCLPTPTAPNPLNPAGIKLILPANGTWTAGINDSSKYAFKWCKGAMIYGGTGSGEGQPFTITTASGSLHAVCGNDPTNGNYYHAEGFSCSAKSGATIASSILEIGFSQDESYVGHVSAITNTGVNFSPGPGKGLWIHAACCSATFEDINVDGNNTGTIVPCTLGDLNAAIHVSKLSCVHPGVGQNAIQIRQSGSANNNGVGSTYKDIYVEEGAHGDNATTYVDVTNFSGVWSAADLLDGLRADIDATGSTGRCMVHIAAQSRINIANLSVGSSSTCAILDDVGGLTVKVPTTNGVIASYDMTPRYLGAMTVSSLPAASANNAGAMFRVVDSSLITSEGQTCATGTAPNTTTALAFSNGSAWKCF
jgi:hypothetical protein